MKQAEKVMEELGNSKALLEIGYENEVRHTGDTCGGIMLCWVLRLS